MYKVICFSLSSQESFKMAPYAVEGKVKGLKYCLNAKCMKSELQRSRCGGTPVLSSEG